MNHAAEQLAQLIATVRFERPKRFQNAFVQAEELLNRYTKLALEPSEAIWSELPADYMPSDVADILSILIWQTNDNGAQIMRSAERWIRENSDVVRIEVALSLDVFPFKSQAEMVSYLSKVSRKHPALTKQCCELISARQ